MTEVKKPHGNTGKKNALKGNGKSDHLHIRIDPNVKALAAVNAAREHLTVSEYVSVLICADKQQE